MRQVTTFQTERLVLRPLVMADLEDLVELYSQIQLLRYIDGNIRSREVTTTYLQQYVADQQQYGFGLYAVILKTTNQMIGRGGLLPSKTLAGLQGELAYVFRQEYWGKGLATEFCRAVITYGFKHFPLIRIFARVESANGASVKVLQKIGMRLVTLRTS